MGWLLPLAPGFPGPEQVLGHLGHLGEQGQGGLLWAQLPMRPGLAKKESTRGASVIVPKPATSHLRPSRACSWPLTSSSCGRPSRSASR